MRDALSDADRRELAAGRHMEVAARARARGQLDVAAWVYEQVWAFDAAIAAHLERGAPLDALRVALDDGGEPLIDRAMAAIVDRVAHDPDIAASATALLRARRRHADEARVLAATRADPRARATALLRDGDRRGAADVLASAGLSAEALQALGDASDGASRTTAAALAWDLGDAEGAARAAQAALRAGERSPGTAALLARALVALGHDLAAQTIHPGEAQAHVPALPGRYRVLRPVPAPFAGAAYVALDRLTAREVELHLLLAEHADATASAAIEAIERFARTAELAAALGHPAIRPIVRIEPAAGLLVLPRAEGPDLREAMRAPGLIAAPSRARALITFLLEGLERAHERGIVHGSLLPGQIVRDAVGRPLLGPFGADALAGLATTRTGGLEELIAVTAPERRSGAAATQASDVFAIGALLQGLLAGGFDRDAQARWATLAARPTAEVEAAIAALHERPEARPSASELRRRLQQLVADLRDVRDPDAASASGSQLEAAGEWSVLGGGVEVTAHTTWSDEALDALARADAPWLQRVIDRRGRTWVLAPWTEGCVGVGGDVDPRALIPERALAGLPPELRDAVLARLQPSSLVRTPSGEWMIALDELLAR